MEPSAERTILGAFGLAFFAFAILVVRLARHDITLASSHVKEALKNLLNTEAEPYAEKNVSLEPKDIARLKRAVPWTYAGLFLSAVAAILIVGWDNFFTTSSTTTFVARLVSAFLGVGSLIVSVIMLVYFNSRSQRIRNLGIKTIIRGIVTGRHVVDTRNSFYDARYDRLHGQVDYYLIFGSKEFSIDYKNFLRTADGDAVELHYVNDAVGKPLVLHFYLLKKEVVSG